jgi:hypothetical protein
MDIKRSLPDNRKEFHTVTLILTTILDLNNIRLQKHFYSQPFWTATNLSQIAITTYSKPFTHNYIELEQGFLREPYPL